MPRQTTTAEVRAKKLSAAVADGDQVSILESFILLVNMRRGRDFLDGLFPPYYARNPLECLQDRYCKKLLTSGVENRY